jgi:pimeloyl-ACP methyl ester carboxylesterase
MRFLPTPDGLTLALHEHGGSGRPTLFCHATGLHGAVWEPLSAALGDGFERWAVDLRAHGASTIPAGNPLPWAEIASDVTTVVDALDLPPGQLLGVGHSLGGACLLLAEQARPGTFAGLWLFEPITPPIGTFPPPDSDNRLADGALRRRPSFPSIADAIANYASKPPFHTSRADALHAYVRHGFVAGEDGAVHLACRPADESQVFRSGGGHRAFDHLGEVACPVVVACSEEPMGPAAFAPAVAAALPRGRLERFRHMTHFGPLEAPTVLAEAIRDFAAEL